MQSIIAYIPKQSLGTREIGIREECKLSRYLVYLVPKLRLGMRIPKLCFGELARFPSFIGGAGVIASTFGAVLQFLQSASPFQGCF